ncbi:A/G-specific adenine glycosylase [Parvularcula oceani]|uniref:A/G-specific adenine glycosylase n=1 Tax=Parvularcula oceani TaxID=1247963 RepID=UPI00068CF959|nr:A/G-specific adenine glycosylase [Parvularcula oceani]
MNASSVTVKERPGKDGFSGKLLSWYDEHARALPWRLPPGSDAVPDPYRIWLSEVMLQQTTVAAVVPRYERFLSLWPDVEALAAAPLEDVLGEWAGLGYYARARNLHACARAVAERGGWPETEEGLRDLPGLGAYTAAAVAAIAFGKRAVVVDGNVERVVARVFCVEEPLKAVRPGIRTLADALTPKERPGDYAQAMMDLGATVCRPKSPQCLLCPVSADCDARRAGLQDELPVRPAKKARPVRYGTVYVGQRRDGAVLTARRPERGLYGGMAGLPGTPWAEAPEVAVPPAPAGWKEVGRVSHGLTHFQLELTVMAAAVEAAPEGLAFTPPDALETLPTVFRKCVGLVHSLTDD